MHQPESGIEVFVFIHMVGKSLPHCVVTPADVVMVVVTVMIGTVIFTDCLVTN